MTGSAICIIPARGGSKRVPGKNIRPLGGKPLIAHSIEAALSCGQFRDVVVSTDSAEIAKIAREHGASVPFLRDAALADDFTGTAEVLRDALAQLGDQGDDYLCCLYPTAPLVTPGDLTAAFERIRETGADNLVCVTEYDFSPWRALVEDDQGRLKFNWPEHELTRSQDLDRLVHDAGAFYWLRLKPFMAGGPIVAPNSVGYAMDRLRCVDIDTEEDFRFAEMLYRFMKEGSGSDDA